MFCTNTIHYYNLVHYTDRLKNQLMLNGYSLIVLNNLTKPFYISSESRLLK